MTRLGLSNRFGALAALIMLTAPNVGVAAEARNPAPTAKDWTAIAALPDFSGVWTPSVTDQFRQEKTNPAPWTPAIQKQIDFLYAEEAAGRPKLILANCMPHGMPSWMLISHNSMEILYSPGRVTLLGESDGNRLRRIYTDGRGHPEDPDLSMHGHSIGHWEGDTLVVDTIGVAPQSPIAMNEAVGVSNNGDMHIVERIHLAKPDQLNVDLEITAPKVFSRPWKTTRIFLRQRAQKFDILEGECLQGTLMEAVDKDGNQIFEPIPATADGSVAVAPK